MKTIITYMYRDASNYKFYQEYVVIGTFTEAEKKEIISCLSEGLFFIPEQVGMPAARPEDINEDDHCWHEMSDDLSWTFKEAYDAVEDTDGTSAQELLKYFKEAKGNWDDITYGIVA